MLKKLHIKYTSYRMSITLTLSWNLISFYYFMLLGFHIKGLVLIPLFVVINQIVLNQVNSLCYCLLIKFSGVVLHYFHTINVTKIILTLVVKPVFLSFSANKAINRTRTVCLRFAQYSKMYLAAYCGVRHT